MQVGSDLKKVKSAKKHFARTYSLDEDMLHISWNSAAKKATKARSECGLMGEEGREGGREGGGNVTKGWREKAFST